MNVDWDHERAVKPYRLWLARGCMPGQLTPVEDLTKVVAIVPGAPCRDIGAVVVARGASARAGAVRDSGR